MATEFDNSLHWGFFLTGTTLTGETGKYVRVSELVLSALRAAGVFSNMVDGIVAPATDKLWLDKNFDPAVLKEWDATGASWVPMTYGRLFGRAAVEKLTVTGGTGNAAVVSLPVGFQANRLYLMTPTANNSGAATINVSGVGTYGVKYGDGSDIWVNEFKAGRQTVLFFTGVRFEVIFPLNAVSSVVDEDDMASNSDTLVPTQQSVKAYVDSRVLDEDDMASDSATRAPSQQSVKAYVTSSVTAGINVLKAGVSAAFDTLAEIATDLGLKMVKSANLSDVASVPTARLNLTVSPYVATRTAMKALDTTKDTTCFLTETGREGFWVFKSGNYTSSHAADTQEGLFVKATAIASSAGSWVRIYSGPVNVKWFGAVGDGTTDDKTAIQAAVDYIVGLTRGGRIYFPTSRYSISQAIVADLSAKTNRHEHHIDFIGDGPAQSQIYSPTDTLGAGIVLLGNASYPETHWRIDGIGLIGGAVATSIGLYVSIGAWASFSNVIVEGFALGFSGTDLEQSIFDNCNFRWNTDGGVLNTSVSTTSPNSLTLLNTTFANNTNTGLLVFNANALVIVNGSFQYNGPAGASPLHFGLKIVDPGDGYGNIVISGTVFEGNGGDADLWFHATTNASRMTLEGCSFIRTSATIYVTNPILVSGTAAEQVLTVEGTTFKGFGGYTPNAARMYIAKTNANARVLADNRRNLFESATETPSGSVIQKNVATITGSTTYNPPSLAAGAEDFPVFAAFGAVIGDPVVFGFSQNLQGMSLTGYVSAADTVTAVLSNVTAGAIDLASGTLTAVVFKL